MDEIHGIFLNYIVEQEIEVVEIPDEFDDLMYHTREVGSRSE